MDGIAGIYAYHDAASALDRAKLGRIRDHMAARGPDGVGDWYSQDGRMGFGHRRLSIIDLSEQGAQPIMSADGRLVVTFNGEIYIEDEGLPQRHGRVSIARIQQWGYRQTLEGIRFAVAGLQHHGYEAKSLRKSSI
jgi:hypothetical protein